MSLRVVEQAGLTDVGRQRQSNEDSYLESAPVFAVADGMGGARAGEVASQIAVEAFGARADPEQGAEQQLIETAKAANRKIYELASQDESRAGMGTTLTAIVVGRHEVVIGHVGDSRAYRFRDGELERLTHDHSLVEEFVRQGKLTPEEAQAHPHRSIITRALGPEPEVEVETYTLSGRAQDIYLLCSDGLTGMVSEESVSEVLLGSDSLTEAARTLVEMANDNGGRDNITVVLCKIDEVEDDEGHDTFVGGPVTADSGQPTRVDSVSDTAVRAPAGAAASTRADPRTARGRKRTQARTTARKRRLRRLRLVAAACCVIVALVVVAGFVGLRNVYFLGTDHNGFIALYRGVPYELPLGVRLYQQQYSSSVPAQSLDPGQRGQVLNHSLRSQSTAAAMLRRLEVDPTSPVT